MGLASQTARPAGLHPSIAIPLSGMLPLFLGALLSDWAYARSEQVQWINFAAWLNAGALVFAGIALALVVLAAAFRMGRWHIWAPALGLLGATFVVGLVAALVHARDAYATMPLGLILSLVTLLLAVAATWGTFGAGFRASCEAGFAGDRR